MSELTEAGRVETRADGTKTFVHGHRFPDNVQVVTQNYNAAGQLVSAHFEWSGLAGKVLDVTATFDPAGKLIKEEGYRAPEMQTPVVDLLKPLPVGAAASEPPAKAESATDQTPVDAPVNVPSLAPASPSVQPETGAASLKVDATDSIKIKEGLHKIYGDIHREKTLAPTEEGKK